MEVLTKGISTELQTILLFIIILAEAARIIIPVFVKTEYRKKTDCEKHMTEIKELIAKLDGRLYTHVTKNEDN